MSFTSDLHGALEKPHRDDSAQAVHELVGNALRRLDPTVDVKRTDYFTHSFVPDLVMRWSQNGNSRERHVHLRFSVRSHAFSQDLDLLGEESPLFLGMTDLTRDPTPAWAEQGVSTNGSLVTESQAVDEFDERAITETRARKATGALVRMGHGFLDEGRAERVSQQYVAALRAMAHVASEAEQQATAATVVGVALHAFDVFLPEEGQLELERAMQSEWIRGGGDPYDFPGTTPWNAELLDQASLREVLNSLLDSTNLVQPETWQRNAGHVRVEDLGRVLGRSLRGGTFNQMAHSLLPYWTAKWAWAERSASPPLMGTYDWIVDNGTVGLEVSDLRTFFADDGRHFKDKPGGNPLPMLQDAQQMLSQTGLIEVALRGPMEGLRYEPLRTTGNGPFARMRELLSAPGAGTYRVQGVTTSVPGIDATAHVDLDRQVIDVGGTSAPVATLAHMAMRFFSRDSRSEGLDHFLATGRPPEVSESAA